MGWKVLYWNSDTSSNESQDAAEQSAYPGNPEGVWGYHAYNYSTVINDGIYHNNRVDDAKTLVNFGVSVPASFKKAPYFVGSAHAGYHVFPGTYGNVVEGHGSREINDPQTIEKSPFNPQAEGGGPQGYYRS